MWSALRATPEAPAAGKRRGEEHHRFHRSEALLAEDARAGRRGGVWGGGLELHYGRVDKVARAARRRQTLAMGFACVRAAFQRRSQIAAARRPAVGFRMWRLSRGVKEGQPSAAEPTEAAEAAEGEESKPEVPEAPEPKASDQWRLGYRDLFLVPPPTQVGERSQVLRGYRGQCRDLHAPQCSQSPLCLEDPVESRVESSRLGTFACHPLAAEQVLASATSSVSCLRCSRPHCLRPLRLPAAPGCAIEALAWTSPTSP